MNASTLRRAIVALRPERAAVTALFFCNGFSYGSWVAHLPALKARFAFGDGAIGLFLLCVGGAALVALPAGGFLVARFGSRTFCIAGPLASAASLVLLFDVPTPIALAAAGALTGACYSVWDVAMNAQAVRIEAGAGRPIMSSFHAWFSVGGLTGSALAALLLAHGGTAPNDMLFTATAFAAVVLIVAPALVSDPPAEHATESGGRGRGIAAVAVLGVMAFFGLFGEGSVGDWSGIYLHTSLGASAAVAAAGFAAFSLAMAIGRIAGDRIVGRYGPRATAVGGGAVAALALAAGLAGGTVWSADLGFAGMGIGLANVFPVIVSASGRIRGLPQGVGIAGVSSFAYAGLLAGPPAIGFVADAIGLHRALGIVVACVAATAVLATRVRALGLSASADG